MIPYEPLPERPYPIEPLPERPYYPDPTPDHDYLNREVQVGRAVTDRTLDLRSLLGLNSYSNYVVDSVSVQIRGTANQATLKLLIDSAIQDMVYAPTEYVTLYPRFDFKLSGSQKLRLQVSGTVYIESIQVRLRESDWQSDWAQVRVPLGLEQTATPNQEIDLTALIDFSQYNGYRLIAVEVDADAYYATEKVELVVNGVSEGSATLSKVGGTMVLFPEQGVILDDTITSIGLYTSGGGALDIRNVTLRLGQY